MTDKNDDYFDNDWDSPEDHIERELEKRRSMALKEKRKPNTKQRLDDYFEARNLKKRNSFLG